MREGLRRRRSSAPLSQQSAPTQPGRMPFINSMGFTEFDLLEPWIKEW